MSGVLKNAFQVSLFRASSCAFKKPSHAAFSRSLSYLSPKVTSRLKLNQPASCACGNHSFNIHTIGGVLLDKSHGFADKRSPEAYNSEKELSQFLLEEIEAEKKLQKGGIANQVGGFAVKLDGSEVILTKVQGGETIEVCFNVNHTVDNDEADEGSEAASEMKSRPNFEVEISRDGKTLGFSCSILPTPAPNSATSQDQDAYNDLFAIDEVVMYSGEWKDTNYSAGGDILDGTLYDMLMDLLEDKGINNDFIEHLSNFSTQYEHNRYIAMLEDIQKFCSKSK